MFAGVCATVDVAALNSQTWCDVTSQTPLEQPSPEDRRRLVEELLSRHAAGGDGASQALQVLWREIYAEVHRLARSMLSREGLRKPIETTVLVHELFLKMGGATFENRAHLFGSLVRMMGQIVTDAARRAARERRAGETLVSEGRGLALDTPALGLPADGTGETSARVIEVLERLDRLAPRAAAVAWLRFVGGLTIEQVAICLDISERTVKTDWAFARAWMHRELFASDGSASDAKRS
jgi:RNA polymerase sigma factor (TIGR02999 family)